jgi:dihydroorotase-like cyclic amidohydrolase
MLSLSGLDRPVHICHMPSQAVLERIIEAKQAGLPVTCGATPHHLFLNDKDAERLGVYGQMKPSLKPQGDVDFLWEHLDDIDLIESDHAPHTHKEKKEGAFGVPGLETTLPLLLTAERDGKIIREQIIDKCVTKPSKLLSLQTDDATTVEVSMEEYEIKNEELQTKCGWSPFAGRNVIGRVQKVTLHGKIAYENGEVLAEPGSGRVLTSR